MLSIESSADLPEAIFHEYLGRTSQRRSAEIQECGSWLAFSRNGLAKRLILNAWEALGGRAIAAVVMLFGISFFAFLTATIAATFVKQEEQPEEIRSELREISARLDRIERALER